MNHILNELIITLCYEIRLDITVIVFAGPNVSSFSFDNLSDHIVDKSVLVPEMFCLKFFLIDCFVETLENILESSIVFFKNSVFGGHVEGIVSFQCISEAGVSECLNGVIVVEHEQSNS